jgi:hypothetical protein
MPTAEIRRGPANTGEPWVFRCVLDARPRVVVAALGDADWADWDTNYGALYQAWQPGSVVVKLVSAVYNGDPIWFRNLKIPPSLRRSLRSVV